MGNLCNFLKGSKLGSGRVRIKPRCLTSGSALFLRPPHCSLLPIGPEGFRTGDSSNSIGLRDNNR